jgi:type VI secretion system protein ImpE
MTATELYKAGRLREAVDEQIRQVKANPADRGLRLFLFELLAFTGDLDRARRQIDALKFDSPDLETAAQSYRKLLDAEEARRKVFSEGTAPGFFGEPSAHLKLRVEAAGLLRLNRRPEAAALLAEADAVTPPVRGTLNGKAFESLRDTDDLFSGVLEVMAMGRYFWVGLDQIVTVAMNPPAFPRDLLYAPARLELADQSGEVFLPALYPGSYRHDDELIRLGRLTNWDAADDGPVLGVGARVLLAGDNDVTLLDWRELIITAGDSPDAAAPEA